MASNKIPTDDRPTGEVDPKNNPGTETTVPTTKEGNTPLDERKRMTGQGAGEDTRHNAEPESPGSEVEVIGSPNQGTESR